VDATVHSKTELQYPDNAPKFEAGQSYKLIVAISDEQNSGNESANGLGFSVLSSKERKVVLEEQKQLERLNLEEGPTQYLVAHLYASHGLNAEAIQRLEAVSKMFMVPATERLLGELYLSVELPRQAEVHYLKSLDLSQERRMTKGKCGADWRLPTFIRKFWAILAQLPRT